MRPSRGMTLLELLLVLALCVAAAAMVLPALRGPLENQRLRKAGDTVRAEWNRTRVLAMKSGRIQIFQCEFGTNRYVVQTWVAETDDQQSTNDAVAGFGTAKPGSGFNPIQQEKEIAEGILFQSGQAAEDSRGSSIVSQFGANNTQQSPPILFYPDGTTSTAKVVLANDRNSYLVVSLRGLTGVAQVSDLLSQEELPP
ncbi:MAG: hypothetical protein RIS70_573 [Planctomycetota bacterium]